MTGVQTCAFRSLLIYPWKLIDEKTNQLSSAFPVSKQTPPVFLVHAHNDSNSSQNSIHFYSALQKNGVNAELIIYRSGGHGNGTRKVANSAFSTWPDRAEDWMRQHGLFNNSTE